jgi:pilus assembly protein CpaE
LRRNFDVVIPEDRRLMNEAIAQGRELSAVRSGSKLEKAIGELAEALAPVAPAKPDKRARRWP